MCAIPPLRLTPSSVVEDLIVRAWKVVELEIGERHKEEGESDASIGVGARTSCMRADRCRGTCPSSAETGRDGRNGEGARRIRWRRGEMEKR